MPLHDPAEVAEKSRALEDARPEDILAWAFAEYSPRIALSTAFGVEGCALIDMAVKIDPRVAIFTVDTDFIFPETRALIRKMTDRYGLNLTTFSGRVTKEEQEARHG